MPPSMNAAEVREALTKCWPESEYVHIPEAPQDSSRQGRKIDVLVISMWASRQHERHAVEIKVSMSDWRRELARGSKADWWWAHTHRFWIAVPEELVGKVKSELPDGWGLISCSPERTRTVVKATRHSAEDIPVSSMLGILRAAHNAGPSALMRARQEGRSEGFEEGKRYAQEHTVERYQDSFDREKYETLQQAVAEFEKESGISIRGGWRGRDAGRVGRAVKLLLTFETDPRRVVSSIQRSIWDMEKALNGLSEIYGPILEEREQRD